MAQNRLAIAVRNFRKQVRARTLHQLTHLVQIVLERLHTFLPFRFARRPRRLWPVAFGKSRRHMFRVAAELQDVPLRDARMLEQLPAGVRQTRRKRSAFVRWKLFQRIHKVHMRGAALQQIDQMFAQRRIAARARTFSARALLRLSARLFCCLLFLQADFSETITCCGMSGTGCKVILANPALQNIFSYSEKVYASPESVLASIIRLNAAAVGGVTRSSLGTNSRVMALPPGFRAACTRRMSFSQVGASK